MKYSALFLSSLCFIASLCFITSCAPKPASVTRLYDILNDNGTISLPMNITEQGLILLENVRVGEKNYSFLLDTGATQSAIFENALERSGLDVQTDANKTVHGIAKIEKRQTIDVLKFEIGPLKFAQQSLIVLPSREIDFEHSAVFGGLIGMDILLPYQIYVSPSTSELKLIPNNKPVTVPASWDRIQLIENPFEGDPWALHFIDVRVAGKNKPALIDTGAEFSAMNWNSAQYQQIRLLKRRLRKEWEVQGAIGTFMPIAKVVLEQFRSGQKFWKSKEFLVMDFEGLEALGVAADESLLIIGMNLFQDETFLIDFERNYIAIKPTHENLEGGIYN